MVQCLHPVGSWAVHVGIVAMWNAATWMRGVAEEVTVAEWTTAVVKIPNLLDCDHLPEWRSFRLKAVEAVANGFAHDSELQNEALFLEEKWRPWVCKSPDGGPCSSSADLVFEFVRELHPECRSSNNFERYLVRHYFHNTGKEYKELDNLEGFCLYGYATVLVVLAWHELPEHVGAALKYLYTAHHLLGHYHSFDYIESSSWPITSFMILLNLLHPGDSFLAIPEPPEYGHPGQYGTNWYYDRLRWAGTAEATKPKPGAAPFHSLPFETSPAAWRGRGAGPTPPRIIVWQFCIHTSTAGEALTMISRHLSHDFRVEFRGNSVAFQLCGNYEPSLCAKGRAAEFLDWLATRVMTNDIPYAQLSKKFHDEMRAELLQADVWMCSIPAVWCQMLMDAAKASGSPQPTRPIFAYLGLPILQYVPDENRMSFLGAFKDMVLDERNIVVANNAYLAEEVLWQTGLRVPTLRIHGLHTNATYVPLRNHEVMVSRPGTSGGLQECLLNQFVENNPSYPVRFVQFTDLLDPHTTREVYNNSLSYVELTKYRALVSFPYDTSLMLFWEFYSANVPTYVPFQLWRWGIFGQHTRRDLASPVLEDDTGVERPPYSPFFDGFSPLEVERAVYWSKFTDWAMFPHVQYFSSIAELMVKVVNDDLPEISSAMKRFNEDSIVRTVAAWRYVVERWLDLETFTDSER